MQNFRRTHRARRAAVRPVLGAAACVLVALAVPLASASSAMAQSGVQVDLSVLDNLGPAETLPGLLYPPSAPRGGMGGLSATGGHASRALEPEPARAPQSRLHVGLPPAKPVSTAAAPRPAPAPQARPPQTARTAAPPPPRPMAPAPVLAQSATPAAIAPAPAIATPTTTPPRVPAASVAAPLPPAAAPPPNPPMAIEAVSPALAPAPAAPRPAAPAPLRAADVSDGAPANAQTPAPTPAPPPIETPTRAAPPPPPVVAPPSVAPEAPAPSVAALPTVPAGAVSIAFSGQDGTLPPTATDQLEAFAARMAATPDAQAQILAYANAEDGNVSRARRLSLTRALATRSFLIERGIASSRIDVRALGNQVPDGAPDRVDVRLITP